jgi:hypothetical protein
MKEQHTPGPWKVSEAVSIEFADGYIGKPYDLDGTTRTYIPMMDNTRLMAAAPEMLELLEAMVGFDSLVKTRAKRRAYQLIQELKQDK